MDRQSEAQRIATTLCADGWDAGAFGDGVRVRLCRGTDAVGGLLLYADGDAWIAKPDDDCAAACLPGDRPFGMTAMESTIAWARATVRDVALTLGATSEQPTWCPRCHGYGSSLEEGSERCTACNGTGFAAAS